MASALDLPGRVPVETLAARLAELAGANPPTDEIAVQLWVATAEGIEATFVGRGGEVLDDAEAAHYAVAEIERRTAKNWDAWKQAFATDGSPDPYGSENPDSRLRSLMFKLLPQLATEFGFRLE